MGGNQESDFGAGGKDDPSFQLILAAEDFCIT